MPSIANKRLLRKNFSCHFLYSNQKLASTQTIGSAFLEKVGKVQNSEYEPEKKIAWFFDGYEFVNGDHVNYSMETKNQLI